MDIYINLFSASVALAGFIAVFLVFRHQVIDTYVDNRKPILRILLESQIKIDKYLAVRIQNIGKEDPKADIKFFSNFNDKAVNVFVDDILKLREKRTQTVNLGVASILSWAILSLVYLAQYYFGICSSITIVFFGLSMILTLIFIIFSLFPGRPA